MTTIRITRCKELVQYWPFFAAGLQFIEKYLRYPYTFETYRRILQRLVTTPTAFVAIVLDDDGTPLCFGAAYDCTPLFGVEKEYDIPFLFHQPNHLPATAVLRKEFERFCRKQKVKRYFMTTTVFNGIAQKCFPRYGFERSHMIFKRELQYNSTKIPVATKSSASTAAGA